MPLPVSRAADATTPDLVAASRGGDTESFGRLVLRYEARVRAVALALGLDPASCEDVAQEAFTAAFEGLPALADPASFPAWVASIARHRAVSLLRRRGIEPSARADLARYGIAAEGNSPSEAVERAATRESVRRALLTLEERQRLALTLRHHAGLSYAEIAETMTLPVTTVKGLIDRGTRALRGLLAGAIEGEEVR